MLRRRRTSCGRTQQQSRRRCSTASLAGYCSHRNRRIGIGEERDDSIGCRRTEYRRGLWGRRMSGVLRSVRRDKFEPKKYFSIDRVFRNETLDATHLAEFHQATPPPLPRSPAVRHFTPSRPRPYLRIQESGAEPPNARGVVRARSSLSRVCVPPVMVRSASNGLAGQTASGLPGPGSEHEQCRRPSGGRCECGCVGV